ncbi:hypothetical protein CB1_001437050 [Camelus ferus]|nr:hypothetical protein CB1_001437050 [Camelus ferus]
MEGSGQGRSRAELAGQDRRQPVLLQHRTASHRLFRWLYEKFRYPFAPMYGGFPVKLRTYLGDPIPYDPKITAEELAEKTKDAVQALIDKHQRIPGNIMSALLERFHRKRKIS